MSLNKRFLTCLAFSLIVFCFFSHNLFSGQELEISYPQYLSYETKLAECSKKTIFDGKPGSFTLKPWDEIENTLKADCLVPIEEEYREIKEAEERMREVIEDGQVGDFAKYYDFIDFLEKLDLVEPSGTRYAYFYNKLAPYFDYRTSYDSPLYFIVVMRGDKFKEIKKIVEYGQAGKISPLFSKWIIKDKKYELYMVNTTNPSYLIDALFFHYRFSVSRKDGRPNYGLVSGESLSWIPAEKIPKVQINSNFVGHTISCNARVEVPMNSFFTLESIYSFVGGLIEDDENVEAYDDVLVREPHNFIIKFKIWSNLGMGDSYWSEFRIKD